MRAILPRRKLLVLAAPALLLPWRRADALFSPFVQGSFGVAPPTISLVTSGQASGVNGGTTSALNCTGATLIVIVVSQYSAGTLTSPTDSSGNTWTALNAATHGEVYTRTFYAANPTVSASQTFSVSNTGISCAFQVMAFSGVPTSPSVQQAAVNSGGSLASIGTNSVTPSTSGALLITGLSVDHVGTNTISGSFSTPLQTAYASGVNEGGAASYWVQPSAASAGTTWTFAGTATAAGATLVVFNS